MKELRIKTQMINITLQSFKQIILNKLLRTCVGCPDVNNTAIVAWQTVNRTWKIDVTGIESTCCNM